MNKSIDIKTVPVSQCEILRELGRGGSSIVYLVEDRESGNRFAMKVLREGSCDAEQLHSEAAVLEELGDSCAGIPSFGGELAGEDGSFAGFLMEYVEGMSLEESLAQGRRFSVRETAEAGLQLCAILEQMHRREPPVIYRDTKPANILIRPDGTLVVVDYGAARRFRPEAVRDTHRLGTEGYAAPEQYGGWEQSDERTDIYGVGAVLHHMLTGLSPLDTGLAPLRDLAESGRIEVCPDGRLPRKYAEMDKILRRSCSASRSMRFSSCRELEKALRGVLRICEKEEKAAARERNRTEEARIRAWKSFRRLALAAMALLVCSGVWWTLAESAGAAQYGILVEEARQTEDPAGKAAAYQGAVRMRPADPGACLAYLRDISEDGRITNEEREGFESAFYASSERMREKDPRGYAGLELEIGKAYFALCEGGPEISQQAFRNALAAGGFLFGGKRTAEAMCTVLAENQAKEKIGAWRILERESVREAMTDGEGAFAAAVCRSAAADVAFNAGFYRSKGIDEEVIRGVADTAEEFLQSVENGWPRVSDESMRELRTCVESAKRRLEDRN